MVQSGDLKDTNMYPTATYFAGTWLREFILSNFDLVGKTFKMKNICVCIEEVPDINQCPDGSVVYRATDTDLSLRVIFTPNSLINANDSMDSNLSVCTGRSLLGSTVLLEECRLTHLTLPGTKYGDFALEVYSFTYERNQSMAQELDNILTQSSRYSWCSEDPLLEDALKFVFDKRGKGTLSVHSITDSLDSLLDDLSWNQTIKYTLYIPPEIRAAYCLDTPGLFNCGKKVQLKDCPKNKSSKNADDKSEDSMSTGEFESARSVVSSPGDSDSEVSFKKTLQRDFVVSNETLKSDGDDKELGTSIQITPSVSLSQKNIVNPRVDSFIKEVSLGLLPVATQSCSAVNAMQPFVSLKRLPSEIRRFAKNDPESERQVCKTGVPRMYKEESLEKLKSPVISKISSKPVEQDTLHTRTRRTNTKLGNVAQDSALQAVTPKKLRSPTNSKISANLAAQDTLSSATRLPNMEPSVIVAHDSVLQTKTPERLRSPLASKVSPKFVDQDTSHTTISTPKTTNTKHGSGLQESVLPKKLRSPISSNISPKPTNQITLSTRNLTSSWANAKQSENVAYDPVLMAVLTSSQIGLPLSDSMQVLTSQNDVSQSFVVHPRVDAVDSLKTKPVASAAKNVTVGYHDAFSKWLTESKREVLSSDPESPDKHSTKEGTGLQNTLDRIASSPTPRVVIEKLPLTLSLKTRSTVNSLNEKMNSSSKDEAESLAPQQQANDLEIVYMGNEITCKKSPRNKCLHQQSIVQLLNVSKRTSQKLKTNKSEGKDSSKSRNVTPSSKTIPEMLRALAASPDFTVTPLPLRQTNPPSVTPRTSRRNALPSKGIIADSITNTSQVLPSIKDEPNRKPKKLLNITTNISQTPPSINDDPNGKPEQVIVLTTNASLTIQSMNDGPNRKPGKGEVIDNTRSTSRTFPSKSDRPNRKLVKGNVIDSSTNTSQVFPGVSNESNKKPGKGNDANVKRFYADVMEKNKRTAKRHAADQENQGSKRQRQISPLSPQSSNAGQDDTSLQTLTPAIGTATDPTTSRGPVFERALLQRILEKFKAICNP